MVLTLGHASACEFYYQLHDVTCQSDGLVHYAEQSGHILSRGGGDKDEDQCQLALPLGFIGGGAVDRRMCEPFIYGCVVEARRR